MDCQLCGSESSRSKKLPVVVSSLAVLLVIIILAVVTFSVLNKNEDVSEPIAASMSRLRKDLFKDYDKLIIPVTDTPTNKYGTEPVEVYFGLSLLNMDMYKDGTVVLDTWLRTNWTDYRLKWDPSAYGNVSVIHLPANQVWLPDIALYNSKDFTTSAGNAPLMEISDFNCLVYNSGLILYIPAVTLKAQCFNGTSYGLQQDWPWGQHECKFKFGSWTYHGFSISPSLYNNDTYVRLHDFNTGPVRITGNTLERIEEKYDCCPEPYPHITATLKLQKLYNVEQSGEITYNPLVDREELAHMNYTKLGWA